MTVYCVGKKVAAEEGHGGRRGSHTTCNRNSNVRTKCARRGRLAALHPSAQSAVRSLPTPRQEVPLQCRVFTRASLLADDVAAMIAAAAGGHRRHYPAISASCPAGRRLIWPYRARHGRHPAVYNKSIWRRVGARPAFTGGRDGPPAPSSELYRQRVFRPPGCPGHYG